MFIIMQTRLFAIKSASCCWIQVGTCQILLPHTIILERSLLLRRCICVRHVAGEIDLVITFNILRGVTEHRT